MIWEGESWQELYDPQMARIIWLANSGLWMAIDEMLLQDMLGPHKHLLQPGDHISTIFEHSPFAKMLASSFASAMEQGVTGRIHMTFVTLREGHEGEDPTHTYTVFWETYEEYGERMQATVGVKDFRLNMDAVKSGRLKR